MEARMLLRSVPALALMGGLGLFRAAGRPHDPAQLAAAEAALLSGVGTPLTHRWVQAGRHQIHTVVGGSGPPLVLLHGHGGGVGVWRRNLDALARHYRLFVVDWLGWGRSERPRFDGRGPEQARDWWVASLEAWRQAMGLEHFYLLGHSLGGWLATEYALGHPDRIDHLILANSAGLTETMRPLKGLFYRVSPQRMVQAAGPLGIRLVEYGCAEEIESSPVGEQLLDYYYQLSVAPLSGQLAFEHLFSMRGWHLPLVPRADQLPMPVTILWGLNDQLFRIRDAHRFQARAPRCELVLCPSAFHSPHFEESERFNDTVIRIRWARPEPGIAEAR